MLRLERGRCPLYLHAVDGVVLVSCTLPSPPGFRPRPPDLWPTSETSITQTVDGRSSSRRRHVVFFHVRFPSRLLFVHPPGETRIAPPPLGGNVLALIMIRSRATRGSSLRIHVPAFKKTSSVRPEWLRMPFPAGLERRPEVRRAAGL